MDPYPQFEPQRRAAEWQRDRNRANGAYSRFVSQRRFARNLGDFDQNVNDSFDGGRFGGSYARRGLLNSGIYKQALSQKLMGFQKQRQDIGDAYESDQRGFDMGDADTDFTYNNTLADIEARRRQAIADAAAQLAQYRQFYGG